MVLATVPGISQLSRYDVERWGDYWRMTSLAARRLFGEVFPPHEVAVHAWGNVAAAIGFLHGLSVEDVEKVMLREALGRSKGNISEAARLLKVTRNTLRYRMGKYNLKIPEQSR